MVGSDTRTLRKWSNKHTNIEADPFIFQMLYIVYLVFFKILYIHLNLILIYLIIRLHITITFILQLPHAKHFCGKKETFTF